MGWAFDIKSKGPMIFGFGQAITPAISLAARVLAWVSSGQLGIAQLVFWIGNLPQKITRLKKQHHTYMEKTCRYFPLSYVLTLVFTVCTIHIYKYMYPWIFPTYTRIHIDTKVGPDIHVYGDTSFGKVAGFKSYLCHADGRRTINSSQCGCRGAFEWMEVPQHTRSTLDILQGLRRKNPNMFLKKYQSFEFRIMSFVQSFDAVFQGRFVVHALNLSFHDDV